MTISALQPAPKRPVSGTSAFLPTIVSNNNMVKEFALKNPVQEVPMIDTGVSSTTENVLGNVKNDIGSLSAKGISDVGSDIAAGSEGSAIGDFLNNEFAMSNLATFGGLAANLLGFSDRKRAMEQQLAQGKVALESAKGDLAFKKAKRANLNSSATANKANYV